MKFDPTITTGNLLTLGAAAVAAAVAWGTLTARMDATDTRATQDRQATQQAIADVREALKEQRQDTKDLQRSVSVITTDTALIRGRLASGDGGGNGARLK